ncbi:hypothetical protein AB0D08_21045 [Kitasatospora sp. NPDC048540]|uniref:hypothetical protein n=1 Tax=unclassified Kitasatospora TaxID=2633591 RepID=UPI0011EA6663|nr:hypothetical protein [Kitasatospora sp. MBT63]
MLAEGEVGEFGISGVPYAAVTTCLTVTCLLDDGNHVGGHLSLQRSGTALASDEVLPAMKGIVGSRRIVRMHLAGVLDSWSSDFLDVPYMDAQGVIEIYQGGVQPTDGNSLFWDIYSRVEPEPDDDAWEWLPPSFVNMTGAFTVTLEAPGRQISPKDGEGESYADGVDYENSAAAAFDEYLKGLARDIFDNGGNVIEGDQVVMDVQGQAYKFPAVGINLSESPQDAMYSTGGNSWQLCASNSQSVPVWLKGVVISETGLITTTDASAV